ncbi:MAG: TonB-dependent receptor [Rhodothermales bacterium]|nr:TonB-dependent receptor [Rhodothermales bacterium]MBO6779275.1 TonB-dependent receptor [Rhodothermales bacterium]
MRRILLLFVLVAFPLVSHAQSRFDVRGVVVDSAGVGLQGATVVALTKPDSVISKFAVSARDGRFALRRLDPGSYVLQITFVGFQSVEQDLEIADADMELEPIALTESVGELAELVVSTDRIPMLVKTDTLEYVAAAFGVRPNATVEDLLKRLPGIEVEDDGTIKAQGEDVENVLVDGKEFFGNDPRIATRNLPAEAVDKVQVYDKQSDMAEFTGVDDGNEEKTINLELTEDAKRGAFGNITAGFGDTERYDGQANINRFTPTVQLALLANVNNINRQGFGFNEYMQFMGGMGAMMDGGGMMMSSGVPLGNDLSDGFSETLSVGVNASRDFGSRTSIRSSYFLSSLENLQDRSILQQQLLGAATSSRIQEASSQTSDNLAHRGNLYVKHTLAEGHDLRLRGNFTASNSGLVSGGFRETFTSTGLTQNTAQTSYRSDGNVLGGDARLTWRKRLGSKGTALVGEATANLNDNDAEAGLANTTGLFEAGDVVSYEEILQEQENLGNTLRQSQKLSLSQPLKGKRVLEASVERRQVNEDQSKSIWDTVTGVRELNDALSSGFDRTYTYYQGGLRFNQNRDTWRFGLGLQVQESQLDGTVLDRDETISSGYTHFLPSANVHYTFRQGMNMDLRYNTSTREPSMNELQPFVDNSDPLNIYVGNPALRPEYRHSAGLHFMYFDQFSFINLFAFLNLTYTDNKIVRSRTVDEQFRQTVTSVNSTGDDWAFRGQVNYGMPIRPIRAKINLSNRAMWSRGLEFINGEENDSRILRNTIEARLENRSKDLFDLGGGSRFTINEVNYSLNERLNQSYVNRTFFGEVTWYPSDTWEVGTKLNYRLYDQDVFGAGENVALWEASVSKTLLRQRAEVQLVGLDLLNQNQGVNFSNGSTYIQEERIETLGRYLMLRFVYHLSDVGNRGAGRGGIEIHAD